LSKQRLAVTKDLTESQQGSDQEETMKVWGRLWQKMGIRAAGQAWGLAPDGQGWSLVGLSRYSADLWQVHTTMSLKSPAGVPVIDPSWLSDALTDVPRSKGFARHWLNMGVSTRDLVTGWMACPVQWHQEAWPAEVQLEVAQALNLSPDEVNFDFVVEALGVGVVHQIHWVGCARAMILAYQDWIKVAKPWRLMGVEPELHAARRAVRALKGGLPSLLQQAPQDWQFRLDAEGMADVHDSRVLKDVMASPAGPRLVASGLALKAWL
jgi:hypothetical protein